MCRRRVLALLVQLLETTLIRVGNEEYARANGSFGLTTLRDRHVQVRGAKVLFRFRGKSGKLHEIDFNDRRLARLVKRCQDLPGEELFQYVDEQGELHSIGSADVNDYLREIAGEEFTAKDFRTWAGTMLAAATLVQGGSELARQGRKALTSTVKTVAARLGNTVAVCRKCYIHPAVFEGFTAGTLCQDLACLIERGIDERASESALLMFLTAAEKGPRRQAG
jgi:DNA topoisomerase-1